MKDQCEQYLDALQQAAESYLAAPIRLDFEALYLQTNFEPMFDINEIKIDIISSAIEISEKNQADDSGMIFYWVPIFGNLAN